MRPVDEKRGKLMLTIFRICLIVCLAALLSEAEPQHTAFRIVKEMDARPLSNDRSSPAILLPVLGFVLDNAGGLRPYIGVPGAASIGQPLNLGFPLTRAFVSPAHDYILATVREGEWPILLQVNGDTITVRSTAFITGSGQPYSCEWIDPPSAPRRALKCSVGPTSDGAPRIDRISLSPTGSAAAFFSESQRRIYVFNNLSHAPAPLGNLEVGDLGPISAMGISDDGKTALVGVSDGNGGALFVIEPGQPPRLVASMRHPSAITFLHRSAGAVIADDIENKIHVFSNGKVFTLATAENGISAPIALAVSKDNQRIFAGNLESRSVTTIGLNRTFSEPLSCNCVLTGLHPTNADSVFRLTDFSGSPVVLFDANGPRTIFVPASSQF